MTTSLEQILAASSVHTVKDVLLLLQKQHGGLRLRALLLRLLPSGIPFLALNNDGQPGVLQIKPRELLPMEQPTQVNDCIAGFGLYV